VNRIFALASVIIIASCSQGAIPAAKADSEIVAQALQKCNEASTKPIGAVIKAKPVEIFDECIVDTANRVALGARKKICALGKSGGVDRSPVEVYMNGDKCVTDYE
jgi:hypothetical protein